MITNILVVSSKAYSQEVRRAYKQMRMNFYIVEDEYQALQYLTHRACQAVILHMEGEAEENAKLLALFRCVVNVNVLAVVDRGYRHSGYLEYATDLFIYPDDDMRLQNTLEALLDDKTWQGMETIDFFYCRGLVYIPCYHKLFYGREEVPLTRKEHQLLDFLIENRHKVLHKEQILQAVWEDGISFASEKTLAMHIKRIRDKIGKVTDKHFIETVHRFGYRFMEYPPPEQLRFAD